MEVSGRVGNARIAIMTITDREFDNARRIFGVTENCNRYWTLQGQSLGSCDYVLVRTAGRFNADAQATVGDLIEDFRPSYIFLVGTCGARYSQAELGDVIVADFVEYVEAIKLEGEYQGFLGTLARAPWVRKLLPSTERYARRGVPYDHPSLRLLSDFAEPLRHKIDWGALRQTIGHDRPESGSQPRVHVANLGCSEKILSGLDNSYERYLLTIYDKAAAWETESYGVAYAVYRARKNPRYNPQYLTVRGVSDHVDKRHSNETRDRWTPYSASVALCFTKLIVDNLLGEVR